MNSQEQYKQLLNRIKSNGCVIGINDELNYCKNNGTKIARLSNGAVIVGTCLGRKDSNYGSININFKRGAIDDPIGKSGLHHFYEHLVFTPKTRELTSKYYVKINGRTGALKMTFLLAGIFNSSFPNIGIRGSLNEFCSSVFNPEIDDISFQNVKNTINTEYEGLISDFNSMSSEAFAKIIYDKNNYMNIDILSSKDILDSITKKDISDLAGNIGPKNLIVSILYDGIETEFDKMFSEITDQFTKMSSSGSISKYYEDPVFYDNYNIDTFSNTSAKIFKDSFHLDSGQIKIIKFTSFPCEYYSAEELTTKHFYSYFREKLFRMFRLKGFSYQTGALLDTGMTDYMIPTISTYESKSDWQSRADLFEEIIVETLKSITSDRDGLNHFIESENLRQSASPISQEDILDGIVTGLCEFDMICDVNFIRNSKSLLTAEKADDIVNKMLKATWHTFVFGKE